MRPCDRPARLYALFLAGFKPQRPMLGSFVQCRELYGAALERAPLGSANRRPGANDSQERLRVLIHRPPRHLLRLNRFHR